MRSSGYQGCRIQVDQDSTDYELHIFFTKLLLGGRFWWRQLYNAVDIVKCNMTYGAMFDEVNEGTAIFKLAADEKDLPQQVELVPLNIPRESAGNLKSDHSVAGW
jgi:hypothetical protein